MHIVKDEATKVQDVKVAQQQLTWFELVNKNVKAIMLLKEGNSDKLIKKSDEVASMMNNILTYHKECIFLDIRTVKDGMIQRGNEVQKEYMATRIWQLKRRRELNDELKFISGMLQAFEKMPEVVINCRPKSY